jgi:uncharacterized protein YkwD
MNINAMIIGAAFGTVLLIVALVLAVRSSHSSGNGNGGGGGDGDGGGGGESGGGSDGGGDAASSTAIQGVIDRQNCYRRAAGLGKLTNDSALQNRAQEWVDYLKEREGCNMRHPKSETERQKYLNDHGGADVDGQNIAWQSGTMPVSMQGASAFNWAADGWYNECDGYKNDGWNKNPGPNPETGHYTQLMWENATKIGCGAASCGGNTALVNCNYGTDNISGGAGNLNPPPDGGRFETSIVPIKCGVNCNTGQTAEASLDSPGDVVVRTGKSLAVRG